MTDLIPMNDLTPMTKEDLEADLKRVGITLEQHLADVDAACAIDRAWFGEHPDKDEYYRRPIAHELIDHCDLVWVRQVKPGVRFRTMITLTQDERLHMLGVAGTA